MLFIKVVSKFYKGELSETVIYSLNYNLRNSTFPLWMQRMLNAIFEPSVYGALSKNQFLSLARFNGSHLAKIIKISIFLTCHRHEIYRGEAVGLKTPFVL